MKISKTKAAEMLGVSPMTLSLMLQQNKIDIGCAYKNNKGNWAYYINYEKLIKYIKGET